MIFRIPTDLEESLLIFILCIFCPPDGRKEIVIHSRHAAIKTATNTPVSSSQPLAKIPSWDELCRFKQSDFNTSLVTGQIEKIVRKDPPKPMPKPVIKPKITLPKFMISGKVQVDQGWQLTINYQNTYYYITENQSMKDILFTEIRSDSIRVKYIPTRSSKQTDATKLPLLLCSNTATTIPYATPLLAAVPSVGGLILVL